MKLNEISIWAVKIRYKYALQMQEEKHFGRTLPQLPESALESEPSSRKIGTSREDCSR